MIIGIMAAVALSCEISDRELGQDLLPPGDNVFLFHDTIFEIEAFPVTSVPRKTSEVFTNTSGARTFLVGMLQDTITGISKASLITQFNTTSTFKTGPNTEIDTLQLSLLFDSFTGNTEEEVTLRVYEWNERVYFDSSYYSDYEVEGKYDPVPLIEQTITPLVGSNTFMIDDQDFINKFLDKHTDTSILRNDSVFKDYFPGLYITMESAAPEGLMVKIAASNPATKLSMKYTNDSTQVDSIAGVEYVWSDFTINQWVSQKINIFEHDFSGTYLEGVIDTEEAGSSYAYVQGMTGVNTRLSFTNIQEWINEAPMAIHSASLILEVVPEEESGILLDDLPSRLMIQTIVDEGMYQPVYDAAVLFSNNGNDRNFGGQLRGVSEGLFFDTTYNYRFEMPLHFQAMVMEDAPVQDFILFIENPLNNAETAKLWKNPPAMTNRIRLEVMYLKL